MNESPTIERILDRVAEREGVDPHRLDPPLFDAVDPEALERVFRNTVGSVTFRFHGYTVEVGHDGTVSVT